MTLLTISSAPDDLWKEVRNTEYLPILAETHQRIRQQMQKARISFDELAPSIESDPALCQNLLMLAARQHPGCVEQISGAANCLSLLGMQELVRLMKKLTMVPLHPSEPSQQAYRRAIMCARFAGNLAAHWATQRGTQSVNYARWSSMLAMAPYWSWLQVWPQAANWQYLLSRGDSLLSAMQQVFGDDEKQWLLTLRQLHLPQMAQQTWQAEHQPDPAQWRLLRRHDPRDLDNQRALIHKCQAPAMISLMANQLAWQLHMAPDGKRAMRWTALVSHWSGKAQFQVTPEVRRLQVQSSQQQHSTLGTGLHLLLSPEKETAQYPFIAADGNAIQPADAELHAGLQSDRDSTTNSNNTNNSAAAETLNSQADAPPASTKDNEAEADSGTEAVTGLNTEINTERHSDEDYMKKLLRQLQQEPDSFGDWHFLMKSLLKGVTEGLGLPSACVARVARDACLTTVARAPGRQSIPGPGSCL